MLLLVIKIISEFLTAVFGVLGTIKDFSKDKESRKWKYITIGGIVISGGVAMITQGLEHRESEEQFRNTTEKLENITQVASRNNEATQNVQTSLSKTAQNMNDRFRDSLRQQSSILTTQKSLAIQQEEAVSATEEAARPLSPVGFSVGVTYSGAQNPCIANHGTRLREVVQKEVHRDLPQAERYKALQENFGPHTSVVLSDKGDVMTVSLSDDSPLVPGGDVLSFHSGNPLLLPAILAGVSFRPHDSSNPTHLSPFSQPAVSYRWRFTDGTSWKTGYDPNGLRHKAHAQVSMSFRYNRDGRTEQGWFRWMGEDLVRYENQVPRYRSIPDLVGTDMTVQVFYHGDCKLVPVLDSFHMNWGQNYTFQSAFVLKDLLPMQTQQINRGATGVLFVLSHPVSEHDLGISLGSMAYGTQPH
jgi:hypothetical protein